jgi:hypothetical protein
MPPVIIDVIAPVPEGWGSCQSCELMLARAGLDQAPPERGLDEYPPEWRADFERLSTLIFDLADRYRDEVLIRVFDPRSLQGLAKALRHRVRHYPTFVIAGCDKVVGYDEATLERTVSHALARG